ncbi:hypothetical protein AYL99_07812 [Fonsecaea erecta]|uniref:Uncharacterized protein n=1 Tax=Fonsecaea erecta TaxID=1367422 RepID=A0A178ZGF8_9EURO|nr:hypothetical protein AYL99_07812 [Fonsecaea erecta]OAP58722.1 hypothetical protein AYL99_07812 [Fonsecaea erecta]
MPPEKAVAGARDGKTAGQEKGRAKGTKRKYQSTEADTRKKQQDDGDGDDGDDDIEIVAERQLEDGSGMEDPLQRQKLKLRTALMMDLTRREQQRHSRPMVRPLQKNGPASQLQKESKQKEDHARRQPGLSPRHCGYIDLTKTSTLDSPRSQLEQAVSPTSTAATGEKTIRELVKDAFEYLDSAAAQRTNTSTQGTGTREDDGEFGTEVVRGVRDGSFQAAVEEFSEQHWALDEAVGSSNAGRDGRRTQRLDTLVDSVRTLRREKAASVDRIAGLLEEKAAATAREAALLRRIAALERMVRRAGDGGEEENVPGVGMGVISPSPTPQAP